jgi:putative ABC transport system permease protein
MRQSLRSWLWKVPVEQEVDEELEFHLEMHVRDLMARGMSEADAREAANRRLGDLQRLKRTCVDLGRKRDRTMRGRQWLEEFHDDLRFAVRQLRRTPAFTLVTVATLALGIGANSAIFALADATLIRPLPFRDADRLVMIHDRTSTFDRGTVAPYEFAAWSARNRTFESMAAIATNRRTITAADGSGEQILTQTVTVRFFDVFGVRPIAGRTFLAGDDQPGSSVVVLGEGIWRSRFGGDSAIVGRQITIDSQSFTVVGVVPGEFRVLNQSSAWMIRATVSLTGPGGMGYYLRVAGRLKPGATLAAAQADMAAVADGIAREMPDLNKNRSVMLEPLHKGLIGEEVRLTSIVLLGVVGFVLLTCCANVVNLLLARTTVRARELAVRSALGAGNRRIVRLLMTESLVLAAGAGVLGAAAGAAILNVAPSLIPRGVLPVDVTLAFNGRVLAFCAVAAVAVALLFGAAPAWQATRVSLLQAMASGGRSSTGSGSRFRTVLATAQVAAAVLLLCGAGLLLRTLDALGRVDPGYRSDEMLTMVVSVPFPNAAAPSASPYFTPESRRQFFDAVEQEVRRLPGVRSASWGSALPLDGWWMGMSVQRADELPVPENQRDGTRYQNVSPAYFSTMGIPILAGRAFTAGDSANAPPVCIVNEEFVRKYSRDRSPVGTRIVIRGVTTAGGPLPVREIVGVVRQVKERPDEVEAQPHVYVPIAQDAPWQASLVVQPAAGPASALTAAVRAAVANVDKGRPVAQVRTMAAIGREATARARFRAVLVATFAGLSLTLAVVGVFGVLAYSVQQRVREFGVRIALGATTANVLRLVFANTARVITAGVLAGLIAAAILGRSIASFLFGVNPLDPVTFGGVAILLALTAALATAVPALRAARVDPIVVLRDE